MTFNAAAEEELHCFPLFGLLNYTDMKLILAMQSA